MFDTVKIIYRNPKVIELENKLTSVFRYLDEDTGERFVRGQFRNFKTSINGIKLTLIGSLAKYYFGNNYNTLDMHSTKEAIEKLEEELEIKLSEALISQIHFAENLILKDKCKKYLNILREAGIYRRYEYSTTVYYETDQKVLSFYDKVEEMKKNQKEMINDSLPQNVLRYELRLNKRLKSQLKRDILTVNDLTDESLFRQLLKIWESEYRKIEKQKILIINQNLDSIPNMNMLINFLAAEGIRSVGESKVKEIMQIIQNIGNHNRMQKKRDKDKLERICKCSGYYDYPEIAYELDNKIKEVVQRYSN